MHLTLAFISLSLCTAAYAAIGPLTKLYITNKDIAPDGFSRPTVLAGASATTGTFPGPLITGKKNDIFIIDLINQLNDTRMLTTTAIHWHGFFQKGTGWADGPVGVNQCPILPGNSFVYGFQAKNQAGTFWYHSHHSTQYCDGLRGPLVVYDPQDPFASMYDIDNESTVITLADWYHTPAMLGPKFPQPNATLINGLGRYLNGPNSPLAVINVQPNKRYRFRLISISCFPNFVFSIDGHNMTIIETDTVNTVPVTVDSIQIFIGQRYSFVLTANQPVDNYWIRAKPNVQFGNPGFANGINSAILRYAGAPIADPTTPLVNSTNPMLETNLHPTTDPAAPGLPIQGGADVNINFDVFFNFTEQKYYVNGASFAPPSSPVLLQVLSGARTAQELLPAGSVYVLPRNKTIEITFPGGAPGFPHPIHLHGQTFNVIRSAGSTSYNYVNPIQRDVVSSGTSSDNITFRFTTNNPGPWIMHCHIDWHLDAGLAVAFVSDIDASAQAITPKEWKDLCPAYINSGLP